MCLSIFPYTARMGDYLKSTGRSGIASASEAFKAHLTADEGCKYDQVLLSAAFPEQMQQLQRYASGG